MCNANQAHMSHVNVHTQKCTWFKLNHIGNKLSVIKYIVSLDLVLLLQVRSISQFFTWEWNFMKARWSYFTNNLLLFFSFLHLEPFWSYRASSRRYVLPPGRASRLFVRANTQQSSVSQNSLKLYRNFRYQK